MTIANISQNILQHLATGPSDKPWQRNLNRFSSAAESFITESIRAELIKSSADAKTFIAGELDSVRSLIPEGSQPQFDLSAARINAYLQSMFK